MADENKELQVWELFREVEKEMSREEKKQVMIEKAINLKLMCDYVVSCSYGDIVLIICMIRDYVRNLDRERDDIQWEAYYRGRIMDMADRLSRQIEYDYDATVEKCRKKLEKEKKDGDIGGDALALTMKYGRNRTKQKTKEGGTSEK